MKYGGDKIKIVIDNLKKGDELQALGFDTCGYMLIGKWNNEYGTKGDPLVSSEVPCGYEGNCPICQEKITDVMDLPGRPLPCDNGDAFLMLSKDGELKVMCKSSFECPDRSVATSEGDNEPGPLMKKLKVCDSDGPLSITEKTAGSYHYACIGRNPSKAGLKFTDLDGTPDSYSKGILYSTDNGINILPPEICSESDYAYIVYNKNGTVDTICPEDISYVYRQHTGGSANVPEETDGTKYYLMNIDGGYSTGQFTGGVKKFWATSDITLGSGQTLFTLTKPGVYYISYGCTLHNENDAGLQAARSFLNVGEYTLESKYDSRRYSKYVNDYRPNEMNEGSIGGERNLELSIMSFSNSAVVIIDSPTAVTFSLGISRKLSDHRMLTSEGALEQLSYTPMRITAGEGDIAGGPAYVSATRIGPKPGSFKKLIG